MGALIADQIGTEGAPLQIRAHITVPENWVSEGKTHTAQRRFRFVAADFRILGEQAQKSLRDGSKVAQDDNRCLPTQRQAARSGVYQH